MNFKMLTLELLMMVSSNNSKINNTKFIILHSDITSINLLNKLVIQNNRNFITKSKAVRNTIWKKNKANTNLAARIYKKRIQCKITYIGVTSRNLKDCIYEHKCDLCLDNHLNSLGIRRNEAGHNFDFTNSKIIKREHNSFRRNYLE